MTTIPDTTAKGTVENFVTELEEIATALSLLHMDHTAVTLPLPAKLTIQLDHDHPGTVDAIAAILGGPSGITLDMGDNRWHHRTEVRMPDVDVTVYCPMPEPRQAKYERLKAELAELDAEIARGGAQ